MNFQPTSELPMTDGRRVQVLGKIVPNECASKCAALFWEYHGVTTFPMMMSCEELIWEAYPR